MPEYGFLPVTVTLAFPSLLKVADVADKVPLPELEKYTLSPATPLDTVIVELPLPEIPPLFDTLIFGEEIATEVKASL